MSDRETRPLPELLADFLRPAFMVRLTVAYLAAAGLLMLGSSVLGEAVARVARDVILLTSATPYLQSLSWTGHAFQATTHLLGGHLTVEPQGYWFMIAFPAGFAAALPGLLSVRGLLRLLLATAISVGVAGFLLAVTVDGLLSLELEEVYVRVNPYWRDMLVRSVMGRFWDFAALMYPFLACLALAWAGLSQDSADAAPLGWRGGALLLSVALVLLAADRWAEERQVGSELELRKHLTDLNPYFGRHLLRRAQKLEAAGYLYMAMEACAAAKSYPRFEKEARHCQKRIYRRIQAREGRG